MGLPGLIGPIGHAGLIIEHWLDKPGDVSHVISLGRVSAVEDKCGRSLPSSVANCDSGKAFKVASLVLDIRLCPILEGDAPVQIRIA